MKIITLNTWGGKIYKELIDFLNKNRDIDIFCFQEILKGGKGQTSRGEMKSLYEDISNIFTDYFGYFSEYGEGGYYSENSKDLDFKYGIACFIKKVINNLSLKVSPYTTTEGNGVIMMVDLPQGRRLLSQFQIM